MLDGVAEGTEDGKSEGALVFLLALGALGALVALGASVVGSSGGLVALSFL